jgi:hypothetical protein
LFARGSIRTAIRRQLETRASAVDDSAARTHAGHAALQPVRPRGGTRGGRTVELRVLGLASLADDVTVDLALATIASVEVLGAFRAPRAVKAALGPRTV